MKKYELTSLNIGRLCSVEKNPFILKNSEVEGMERTIKNVSKNYELVAGAEEHIHEEIVKVTLPKECTRKVWVHDDRSFIDEKGFFNVFPVASDEREVVIVCPYCKRYHVHGKCNGSRVPHCMSNDIDMVNAMRKALGMRAFTIHERDYIICGVDRMEEDTND